MATRGGPSHNDNKEKRAQTGLTVDATSSMRDHEMEIEVDDEDHIETELDELLDYLQSPLFVVPIREFIDDKALSFIRDGVSGTSKEPLPQNNHSLGDPMSLDRNSSSVSEAAEAMSLMDVSGVSQQYVKAHTEYAQLVDDVLETYLDRFNISSSEFVELCQERGIFSHCNRYIFEQLVAADDLRGFSKMLERRCKELSASPAIVGEAVVASGKRKASQPSEPDRGVLTDTLSAYKMMSRKESAHTTASSSPSPRNIDNFAMTSSASRGASTPSPTKVSVRSAASPKKAGSASNLDTARKKKYNKLSPYLITQKLKDNPRKSPLLARGVTAKVGRKSPKDNSSLSKTSHSKALAGVLKKVGKESTPRAVETSSSEKASGAVDVQQKSNQQEATDAPQPQTEQSQEEMSFGPAQSAAAVSPPQPSSNPPSSVAESNAGMSGANPFGSYHEDDRLDGVRSVRPSFEYSQMEVVGVGAFGKVFRGQITSQEPNPEIAIKQIELTVADMCEGNKILKEFHSEIELLKEIDHPNTVKYYGTEATAECLKIFLEYVPGGTISTLIKKAPLDEERTKFFTRQILSGLSYLHSRRIIHRDIKGANILLGESDVVKLADFGASKKLEDIFTLSGEFHSVKGTPFWMAPEVIIGSSYGRRADVWSVGCVVIEMLTGRPPWSMEFKSLNNSFVIMYHIVNAKSGPKLPKDLSPECEDFLSKCFQLNPKDRPLSSDLLDHPWIAQ